MIVRIRLELTDDELRKISSIAAGKVVKRKAKREEVDSLMRAMLLHYLQQPVKPREELSDDPVCGDRVAQSERVDARSSDEQIDDKGGHEGIMRAMSKQQRAALMRFNRESDGEYWPIGFVGDDLIIERDYANSVIRQRISPAGRSATCRSGSFRPIQPMKS